jgi:tetratricopeptide (TPR) repeat protein
MKINILLIILIIIAAAPGLWAQPAATQAETPKSAADLVKAGDDLYAKFDDAGALAQYEQAAKLEPSNYEALWKTARAYMNAGDRVNYRDKDHEQKMLGHIIIAEQYLKKALAINPNDSRTRFLNAAILGRQGRAVSRRKQVALAYATKAEIDRALALDPKNDMAWHALAYWHRTLAEVGGATRFFGSILFGRIPKGSYDEAVKGFQKAIALNPDYCNNHIELARTYIRLKKKDLAAKEYEAALACPDLTSMCGHFKERAKRELERLRTGGEVGVHSAAD